MITDPPKAKRDGPSTNVDPGDSRSGEGVSSVRRRLQRTLDDSARRSSERQMEAMTARTPDEAEPEPDAQ